MKEKTSIRWVFIPLAVMLVSFIGITVFSMIYMAKDNNYDNMIYQYFNISKAMYGRLIYLSISKEALITGMNLCSLSFLLGNFVLFWFISSHKERKKRKGILLFVMSFLLLQAVVYSTGFQKALYFGRFGFLPDPRAFRNLYKGFHYVTIVGNFLALVSACIWMLMTDLRRTLIPELWRIKGAILMTEICMAGLYFYLYYSLPDSFLWISRSTGYIAYHSLKMAPYVNGMRVFTYLIVLFLGILFYNLYRYQRMRRKVSEEEYVFSSIIASSEISTRAFSHYVKNELLGIMAETENVRAGQEKELENIRRACQEMYDRLSELQKNTNRIVLNQSRQNLTELVTRAVEENRALLTREGCEICWNGCGEKAEVFLDPYYMQEVFRNIFQNAVEAMEGAEGDKKIYVELKTYGEEAEITIEDTGPGLSETVKNRLFEPFVSTKSTKRNWGIGLSFCKRIITSHRGKITAENGSRGAVFRILLPVTGEEA